MINFSELVWRSGRTKDSGFRADVVDNIEPLQPICGLDRVPVEGVELGARSRLALLTNPQGPSADRFRFLRLKLGEIRELVKLRNLAITSPSSGDGKSTVAISLATALAGDSQSVLLIEGDLHHPSLTSSLGVSSLPGLAECLEGHADPLLQIRRLEPLGWYFMSAGVPRGNPTELLQSESLSAVMKVVSSRFDWVLIDTPPVLPLTDTLLLSRQADATLLVARAGCTSRAEIDQTLNLIGRKHVLGVVLNGVEEGQNYIRSTTGTMEGSKTVHHFNPLTDNRWGPFLSTHPKASVFHSSAWLTALRRTYRYEPIVFTHCAPAEDLTNAIVFCRVNSWLTGARLASLPFSDHCDILANPGS